MDKNLYLVRKVIWFLLTFFLVFAFYSQKGTVLAEEKIVETSATFLSQTKTEDKRGERLKKFLEFYNSPLASYSDFIVKTADCYSLDWKLVPAISGIESSFGKQIPAQSFNAYGWNNGHYYFKDWQEGIETVSKALKENYIDKGAKTVEEIGPIYAPPSPFWGGKVTYFMKEIENFSSPSSLQFSL